MNHPMDETDAGHANAATGVGGSAAGHIGHDHHAGHSVAMFRDKFWLTFALTIPVLVWSGDPQHWLGYAAPVFAGSALIPPILGTIVFLYGGARRPSWRIGSPG